jgi:hypothetical protein
MLPAEFAICAEDATLPAKVDALDCCAAALAWPSCDMTDASV